MVICLLPAAAAASQTAIGSPAPPPLRGDFLVGVDDDHSKWLARPDGRVAKYRDLGVEAVRLTIPYRRGQSRPTNVRVYLHRGAMLIQRGQRVVIGVFGRPEDAPLDAASRRQYCDFLHYVLVRIPFRDVVIWNEANSPTFWPRSGGARAYEQLLATCWRRLHELPRTINVISTTAARYDPAGFMREVGQAYRERGRRHPLVDTFGHNPYPQHSGEPPWIRHSDPRTVAQADLPRYLDALRAGFEGTPQPLPLEGNVTVWYLETGFQTTIPRSKRRFYHGVETDPHTVPPVAPEGSEPWVRDQASQLRDALLLARCQAGVGAFFNFELLDEDRLAGWQSGVLWRDGTHKASYDAFKGAVDLVASGKVDCGAVAGAGGPLPPTAPAPAGAAPD